MEKKRKTKSVKGESHRKVVARINAYQHERLSVARDKYGFKSNYEVMQYLVASFLRVIDPDNEEKAESIPDEIKGMFSNILDSDRNFEFVKPKRKQPQCKLDEINRQREVIAWLD